MRPTTVKPVQCHFNVTNVMFLLTYQLIGFFINRLDFFIGLFQSIHHQKLIHRQ